SEAGADLRQINIQVMDRWRAMMLAKNGADIGTILDITEEEIKEIKELAQYFSLEELPECARIFAQNDLIQKNTGTPQLGLELAFLACLDLHRRGQSGQSQSSASLAPTASVTPLRPAVAAQSQPRSASVQEQRTPNEPLPLRKLSPTNGDVPVSTPRVEAKQTQPPAVPPPPARVEAEEALPDWDEVAYTDVEADEPAASPVPREPPVAAVSPVLIRPEAVAPV